MQISLPRFAARLVLASFAAVFISCDLYYSQTDPYSDPPPVTVLSIRLPSYNKTFYDTSKIKFQEPVWFGEYSGIPGTFITGELGGDLYLLEPIAGGFQKTLFGHIPAAKITGNDGLLGLAFHPDFKNNHKYYVYYNPSGGHGILEERLANSSFKSDEGFSRLILQNDFNYFVHNGGDVHFGKDGYLYLSLGDWGNPGNHDTLLGGNSQNLHVLNGKMIRIDVNSKTNGLQYGIPSDNPFLNKPDTLIRKEIYASGFRNPWRWNFDPLNGKIYLGDVGNGIQEEVDTVKKGGNYGWPRLEGNSCYNDTNEFSPLKTCNSSGLVQPLAVITHDATSPNRAVIGGIVFRGNPASPYYGAYVYGDCVTGTIYLRRPAQEQSTGIGTMLKGECVDSFGTDFKGNIYLVGYYTGIIYRFNYPDLMAP